MAVLTCNRQTLCLLGDGYRFCHTHTHTHTIFCVSELVTLPVTGFLNGFSGVSVSFPVSEVFNPQ